MRVVLDECLPRPLGAQLRGHRVTTVQNEGWAGTTNGELLKRIGEAGHEAFITVDKNLPRQQALRGIAFGIVVLKAKSNKLEHLTPLIRKILAALNTLRPGTVTVVSK